MYAFVLNMWVMRKVTEKQVRSYNPLFLKSPEVNMILATPQFEQTED
jgi:hypothetical protein